jgi:thiol-disulfide isomerase/thioredoxin
MPVRKGFAVISLAALFSASSAARFQQPQTEPDIVAQVRTAMANGGIAEAEKTLSGYRAAHGSTADAVEALQWLARGALRAKLYDKADSYARETQRLAKAVLSDAGNQSERMHVAIATSTELLALVLIEKGWRSDAVHLLRTDYEAYRGTPAADLIKATLDVLSLEGQPAPSLSSGITLGAPLREVDGNASRPTLVFFWAHWCQECKAEGPMLERLVNKYRAQGLAIVAPTRRYGYITAGRPAAPGKELQHISRVRDSFYRFLKHDPVPVADVNYAAFGISVVPVHVLIDRQGVIRLYHPGRIDVEDLEAAIVDVLRR